MVFVVSEPRRKSLGDLQSPPGARDAHDIGAIYPWDSEFMFVDMRERQRELNRERGQREIGSASPGEGSQRYRFRPCQRAVPLLTFVAQTTALGRTRAMAALGSTITCNGRRKYGGSRCYGRPVILTFPFEGAGSFCPVASPSPARSCGRSPTASVGGKMLSYIARASRMRRSRSSSDFVTNSMISPISAPSGTASLKALP